MNRYILLAIGLLSAALLAFQIVLLQAFATMQWYHFAYMVISVALLGFGASGTALTLARDWFDRHASEVIFAATLLSGVSMPVALALSQRPAASFDSYLLLTEADQIASLALTYVLLTIPFFSGALAIGLSFVRYTEKMGALYFANLVGSGAGGLLGLALLYLATPPPMAAVAGLIAIGGAGVLLLEGLTTGAIVGWVTAVAFTFTFVVVPPSLKSSEYKDLDRVLLMPDVEIVSTRPHPQGVVQIVRSDLFRQAPGLSLTYRGDVASRDLLFVNRDLSRSLGGPETGELLDFSTAALPYVLKKPERVLILGGIRVDAIAQALSNGATRVVVPEPHGGIYRQLAGDDDGARYPTLQNPRVEIHAEESRSLVGRAGEPFDLIVLQEVGSFGGTSGLFALQEQYDLTLEALDQMWSRLAPDGSLSVTAWVDYPPRNTLRILSTLIEMLERRGVQPVLDHLVAVRSWGAITFVTTRRPVDDVAIDSVRAWSERLLFDPLVIGRLEQTDRQRYNTLQDESFFNSVDSLLYGNRSALYNRYSFRIQPTTDNRPYFSQTLKWGRLGALRDQFGEGRIPFFELGTLIVGLTLSQIVVAAIVLIVLPLMRIRWTGSRRWWTIIYFGGLAAGFMFFEIVMIQRYTMYLGHPVLAVAFVFTVLLISSGLGSIWSSRLAPHFRSLRYATGAIATAMVIMLLILTPALDVTIGWSTSWKLLIGVLLLAPVSFLMGIPFPLGLRTLQGVSRLQVPWAWAINGCISVGSAPAAVLLSAEAGAAAVLFAAVAAYALVSVTSGQGPAATR